MRNVKVQEFHWAFRPRLAENWGKRGMSWRNTCQSLQKRVVWFLIESTFFFGCFLHLWVISHARKERKIKVMTTVTFAKQSLSKRHSKMDNRLSWSLRFANNFQSEVVLVFSHLDVILVNTSYHLTILIPSLGFFRTFSTPSKRNHRPRLGHQVIAMLTNWHHDLIPRLLNVNVGTQFVGQNDQLSHVSGDKFSL